MSNERDKSKSRASHRLTNSSPKLWCVAYYGYNDWFGGFAGYVGDGVTSPSQHLVGVYETESEACEALTEAEAEEESEKPEFPDARWRSRSLEVKPFRPADFARSQWIENEGIDSVSREIIRSAAENDIWHAETPPDQAVETLLIVYAILDVSPFAIHAEVYNRLDDWSQHVSGNGRWDDSFVEYAPESWEVDGDDVRHVVKRSGRTRVEAGPGERRLFRLAYSRDDENCWDCKGIFEIKYNEDCVYDLIYDLESDEKIFDSLDPNNRAVAEALGEEKGRQTGS